MTLIPNPPCTYRRTSREVRNEITNLFTLLLRVKKKLKKKSIALRINLLRRRWRLFRFNAERIFHLKIEVICCTIIYVLTLFY